MTTESAHGTQDVAGQGSPSSLLALERSLHRLADEDSAYWSFTDKDDRQFVHSMFQYPAMMVPRLQRALLEECLRWDPAIDTVYDPFAGSGTVLTETMLMGRNFTGGDINPLAVLVCRAKAELFDAEGLNVDLRRLLAAVDRDASDLVEVDFPRINKWFEPHVITGLSRLRRAISARPNGNVRRFWWVALAETVRLSSNSRTSTVKLHLRPKHEVANRPDPVQLFRDIAQRNLTVLREQQQLLAERRLLRGSKYVGMTAVRICDVRHDDVGPRADLVMTSPPYGDNHTTVTYGQASYLPLQWIDRRDISAAPAAEECVASTHRTDTRSLGGRQLVEPPAMESLLDRSPHLRTVRDKLAGQPRDRWARVGTFYKDLDDSLGPILNRVHAGGLLLWTTGDRSVGGVRVPMAPILRELLGRRTTFVARLDRSIPPNRKRMASRNATTATMRTESILVVRKRGE